MTNYNKNKYFVKILWHLLGECVKTTVLLVYSICIFFFNHRFVLFFLIYKSAYSVFVLYIYSAILLSHFVCLFFVVVVVFFFFFKFWTVATVPSWFNQLCWAKIHYSTYNFFGLTFCIFFSLHIILSKNT